jgi:hypothetical protein
MELGPIAHSMAEAEEMIAALQQENPDSDVHTLRIATGLVEAGIQITILGPGLHAVVTLDPTSDPRLSYAVIDNLPHAVHSALLHMSDEVAKHTQREGTHDTSE